MQLNNSSRKAVVGAGRHGLLIAALLLAFIADRLTKSWALSSLPFQQPVPVIGSFFSFTLTTNTGAAFSILSGKNALLIVLSFLVICAVLYAYARMDPSRWNSLAIGLILGGAIGNFFDRIMTGAIVDFIHFPLFPIFNVADIAISTGVLMLLGMYVYEDFILKKEDEEKHSARIQSTEDPQSEPPRPLPKGNKPVRKKKARKK